MYNQIYFVAKTYDYNRNYTKFAIISLKILKFDILEYSRYAIASCPH